ncbi:MAG: cell division ATP-binding protein FtsE [bacterium]|nr:cell division ATP-binding protein FtsE [bacterium]
MIYFDNVSKVYSSDSVALDSVTFAVEPKEFLSLVGHSGAGKSTLIKLLLAEEKPSSGNIYFESIDVHELSRKEIPYVRRKIGTVFQDFKLLPHKTAYENVSFALEAAGRDDAEIAADVPHVLELVGLADRADHFPHELSGGQQQRVAIARAIVSKPDVIVADEPTGNLDPLNTWEIVRLLGKINELGTTVILATHDKEIIDTIGKRVITFKNGRVVSDDKKGKYRL